MPNFIENLPILRMDAYKASHQKLYPKSLKKLYSVLTPRKNSYFPWFNRMVSFGYQMVVDKIHEDFEKNFFNQPLEDVLYTYERVVKSVLGECNTDHIKELWELQYLPLEILVAPEGELVPMGVPTLTIRNTDDRFPWLPNMLETFILAESYPISTAATTAYVLKAILSKHWENCSDLDPSMMDYQCHDFSERGHHGNDACKLAGLGHLLFFKGTDTFQAVMAAEKYYDANLDDIQSVGASVVASEHSVMECFGTDQDRAFKELLEQNPNGVIALVADTYDYWDVINRTLPSLKDLIMSRNGTLTVRPDTGDAKEIIGGTLESLYKTFGGEKNSKGYIVLDSHIRMILGEGISLNNFEDILIFIQEKGFSIENVYFGIGAYSYSVLNTRDTFGHAIKAQHGEFEDEKGNRESKMLYKDPKTDPDSLKKSLKGAVALRRKDDDTLYAVDHKTPSEVILDAEDEWQQIYDEGVRYEGWTLDELREIVNKRLYLYHDYVESQKKQ